MHLNTGRKYFGPNGMRMERGEGSSRNFKVYIVTLARLFKARTIARMEEGRSAIKIVTGKRPQGWLRHR